MIGVHFDKAYVQSVLKAIEAGSPIPTPPRGQWTANYMLTLAGIFYSAVVSHGPQAHQIAGITEADRRAMHPERQEAVEVDFQGDIHDAIEFVSVLTLKVMDDEYDGDHEPVVEAVLGRDADGERFVHPHKGFKAI
jgi:hypothetical protein